MTSIMLSLELFGLEPGAEDVSAVVCPHCGGSLTILQPDERLPDRLMGTCDTCPSWFLIEMASATMVRLPKEGSLRAPRSARSRHGPAA